MKWVCAAVSVGSLITAGILSSRGVSVAPAYLLAFFLAGACAIALHCEGK